MKRLILATLLVGALLTLSACASMATEAEAPQTGESDAPVI